MTTMRAVGALKRMDIGELAKLSSFSLLNFSKAETKLKDMIPMAKIEYLASKNLPSDYKKGAFTFNLGYQKDEVRMVLLAMKFERQLWDKYNPNKEAVTPICFSSNGEFSTKGTLFSEDKPQSCNSCKHSQWNESQPSTCQDVYSLLAYDLDDSMPFIIQAKRTSIYPLRKLKTALKISATKFAYPGAQANTCVSIVMRSKPVDNYYILDFPQRDLKGNHLWTRLPEKQAQELTKIAIDLSSTFIKMDFNDDANSKQLTDIPF